MSRPRALDLFCKAGGASMGLWRAGFDVTGYDLVWASPPCQRYSVAANIHGGDHHPDHVSTVRARLIASGLPYIIENVPGAPLREPITLCGLTFGLGVKRHRNFECSFSVRPPGPCPKGHPGAWVCVFGHTVLERSPAVARTLKGGPIYRRRHLGHEVGATAMGIDWMCRDELSQAIPPVYAEYLGRCFLREKNFTRT